jgi:Holliday junction resolvase
VSGEIEFIEVKSNKAIIPPYQINNYKKIIENGYKMRYFHVDIISFKQNIFDIDEKVLNDIIELKKITGTRI